MLVKTTPEGTQMVLQSQPSAIIIIGRKMGCWGRERSKLKKV